ncbi:MAG: dockerin type I repeat-containing protein [Clostridia bacterium]|nr:dockerin type I repeat-containing protein [Clostridia bacterium]
MKPRKLFALLLAVLMLAAAFPNAIAAGEESSLKEPERAAVIQPPADEDGGTPAREGFAAAKGDPEKDGAGLKTIGVGRAANDDSTGFLYTWANMTGHEADGYNYAETDIKNSANSQATLTTEEFYMTSGEWISFWYWYETEEGYDKFYFYYNQDGGASTYLLNGLSGYSYGATNQHEWVKYTFRCTSSGRYTFTWKYYKDGTTNSGADCVRISRVTYSAHYDAYLYDAALCHNGTNGGIKGLTFNQGDYDAYAVETDTSGHELYITMGNHNKPSSTSIVTADVFVPNCNGIISGQIMFDYAFSTEANHDVFRIYVDGVERASYSGSDSYTWRTLDLLITGSGIHTVKWVYQKDSSVDSGSDAVCIDNIKFWSDAQGTSRCRWYTQNLNSSSSDARLTFNTPANYESFVPCCNYNASDLWVAAANRFSHSTDSAIYTMVNMDAGEMLSFQYFVQSEKDYDRLELWVNDQYVTGFSGWDEPTWTTYTYTAPSRGCYKFTWMFHKDSSYSVSYDKAYIDNVCYMGRYHNNFTLNEALNAYDTSEELDFYLYNDESGSGSFMPCSNGDFSYAISRNALYENTRAILATQPIWLNPGDFIAFSWKVNDESYDKLKFTANGPEETFEELFYGNNVTDWTRYVYTAETGGSFYFEWTYINNLGNSDRDDCAMITDVAIEHQTMPTLDEILNESAGGDLHFITGTEYDEFVPACEANDWYAVPAVCGRTWVPASRAFVQTVVKLDAGDKISFYYRANPIEDGMFAFMMNGTERLTVYDTEGDNGWHRFEYTAYTSGRYELKWLYDRPEYSHVDAPDDVVSLDDVKITRTSQQAGSLDESLNFDGGMIHFENVPGSVPFVGDFWSGDKIVTSGNIMQGSTVSAIRTTLQLTAGDVLNFEYFYSCEGNNYDYFEFLVDGTTVFKKSGDDHAWHGYSYEIETSAPYTFEWRYRKDSSVDVGYDCVKLENVYVEGSGDEPTGMLGDVNNDGVINTEDALYVLRHALGIIVLPEDWQTRADVGEDCFIDTTDALYILRYALNIITEFP